MMNGTTRSLLLFGLYVIVGFAIQVTPFVDREFVAPFIRAITAASGGLINLFGGAATVTVDVIQSPLNGFAVKVDNGCSGLEAVILICAAVLAFPTTWKMRLIGVLACSAAILGVNLIRIISLFYIGQYSMEWFDWAHLYAWDILIMLDGLVAILLWIRYALSHTPKTAPVDALHS
jgi:exosortase H (IPTLxxWG-CTERM-specific)